MTEQSEQPGDSRTAIDQMVRVLNDGWLVLVLSLGERTGLHEALDAEPRTAAEIAQSAECDERFTEIWLWSMVAGGFVTADAGEGGADEFALAPGAVTVLTKAGGPNHWARITEQITALAAIEDDLVEAFHTGTGLPAALYEGRITEVLSMESGPIFERVLLEEVLPHTNLDVPLAKGARVADLGCGTGDMIRILAQRFPKSSFIGVDQSHDALVTAAAQAGSLGLTNVEFAQADLEDGLGFKALDLIIAANVAHDLSDPGRFFREVHRALRPGGTFYLHELTASNDMLINVQNPHSIGILAFSLYHCLPLAKRRPGIAPGGMFGRERYLAALVDAGFVDLNVFNAPSDPNNDTITAKKRES